MGAKRGTSKRGQGPKARPARSAGGQLLALIALAILLVGLFVGFAIAQGIGQPSVPAGAVAIVKGVPSDVGTISKAEFTDAVLRQVARGGLKKAPKLSSKKGEELKKAAMEELIQSIWIQGAAEELGITVTPKQVATEFAQIKKQNFKTKKAYQEFLKSAHFTQRDVLARVKLQLFSNAVQKRITEGARTPSSAEISGYYDAAKSTQFTTKPTRNIRLIVNKDKKKAAAAAALLRKANSPAGWKKVAKKYSTDPTTKAKGGLQENISEEILKEPLQAAIFKHQKGEVVGPVVYEGSSYVIEVVKLNPEKVQTLDEAKTQISSTLTQQLQQEASTEFISNWQSKWQSRTFCAAGYVIERCANYVGSGHSSSAPPGCYEAEPKGGPPKECPAPVAQAAPAMPGTTTLLKPQGERLPQRPRPESSAAGTGSPITLPGSTGAAPEG